MWILSISYDLGSHATLSFFLSFTQHGELAECRKNKRPGYTPVDVKKSNQRKYFKCSRQKFAFSYHFGFMIHATSLVWFYQSLSSVVIRFQCHELLLFKAEHQKSYTSYSLMLIGLVYPARLLHPKGAWDFFLSLLLFLLKRWDLIKITQGGTNPECPFPPILNNNYKGKFNFLYLSCMLLSSEHAYSCYNCFMGKKNPEIYEHWDREHIS